MVSYVFEGLEQIRCQEDTEGAVTEVPAKTNWPHV